MRKKLINRLSLACILLLCCGFMALGVSCGKQSDYTLYGFTPVARIEAKQGDFVQTETMHVFDSEDNYYNVSYKVLNGAGNSVETSGKGFFALEAAEYKIVYTVIGVHGTETRETLVSVKAGDVRELSAYVPETGTVNEPVEIVVESTLFNEYEFTVTVSCGGDAAEVKDFEFTPVQTGAHTVKITAVSDSESITRLYTVNVGEAPLEGAVAVYDEGTGNLGEWSVVTSEESGLKDRFGGDGSFLYAETDTEFLNVFISPKHDKKYYEELAEQGYEYVSVWVYLDGRLAHKVQQSKGYGAFYQTQHRIRPQSWYEIRYNLKDDPKLDYEGSFLKGFDYYVSKSQYLFLVDNSDLYNLANGGRERDENGKIAPYKIYIDDIYAVKKGESIALNESAKPALKTGDSYDLKNLIDSEIKDDLIYTVTYRDRTTIAENGNYTFTANGTYEITASYGAETPNVYGGVSFSLNVAPKYTASVDSLIREKTGDSVTLDLKDLNVSLKDESGAAVSGASVTYAVTKNGGAIPVNGDQVRITSVGCYEIEAQIGYRSGDVDCTLYVVTQADIWDRASKYTVFDFDGNSQYFADSYYMNKEWEIAPKVTRVTNAHGKSGNFAKVTIDAQQQPIFGVKPAYSLNYYRMLLEEAEREELGELLITFDYFVEDAQKVSNSGTRRVGVFPASGSTKPVSCGVWHTVEFTLEELVNGYYEQITAGFDYLNDLRGGENITVDWRRGDAFFYLANSDMYATELYFGGAKIQEKTPLTAEEWAESLKGDKTVADYTQGDYAELYNAATGQSFFERNHVNMWQWEGAEIVTETVGGKAGTYAKLSVDQQITYNHTVPVYLPNTLDLATLKEFAKIGYVLKVNVLIDASVAARAVYTLEYDETAKAFKDIYNSSRVALVQTGVWQEIEIDLNDYILMCGELGSNYAGGANHKTSVIGVHVNNPWTIYFGEPYLDLPAANESVTVSSGERVSFAELIPDDGGSYEYYKYENGEFVALSETSVVTDTENFSVVIVRERKQISRTIVAVLSVAVFDESDENEMISEWLETANGEKKVADYTKEGYADLYDTEKGRTFFQRNHETWPIPYNGAEIVTEEIGGERGTYAKITAYNDIINYDTVACVYLPNTINLSTLKKFAASGFVLKVKVFIELPEGVPAQTRKVFTMEYDEAAGDFKKVPESSRVTLVQTGVWQEVEIDLNDYIRLCEQRGNHYAKQNDNQTQGVIGVQVRADYITYYSELYLALPEAEDTLTKSEGDKIDCTQYLPDGETYEFYTAINGVIEKVEGTEITAGRQSFELVIVQITGQRFETQRKVVKTVSVTVG